MFEFGLPSVRNELGSPVKDTSMGSPLRESRDGEAAQPGGTSARRVLRLVAHGSICMGDMGTWGGAIVCGLDLPRGGICVIYGDGGSCMGKTYSRSKKQSCDMVAAVC